MAIDHTTSEQAVHAPQEQGATPPPDNMDETKKSPSLNAKEEAREFMKSALIAILLAVIIRAFLWEPFNIPSSSMKPTLLVGDYLFVSKASYGYSRYSFPFGFAPVEGRMNAKQPKRGDIIVFKLPSNPKIDYIKRLVALPGETVQVKDGRLYINGKMIPREAVGDVTITGDQGDVQHLREYIETLPGGVKHAIYEHSDSDPLDNTPLYTVPEGHYFMMGDNRDHSQDSRVTHMVGAVPFENLIGRADVLFFSTNGAATLFEPWKWPWSIRYSRLFKGLAPDRPAEE